MTQLAMKILWARQKNVWNCGKNISKTHWRHLRKYWNVWRIPTTVGIWFHSLTLLAFVIAMAFSIAGGKDFAKDVGPHLDPWDVVRMRT